MQLHTSCCCARFHLHVLGVEHSNNQHDTPYAHPPTHPYNLQNRKKRKRSKKKKQSSKKHSKDDKKKHKKKKAKREEETRDKAATAATAAQQQFGKYGVIKESDMETKRGEFMVRKGGDESMDRAVWMMLLWVVGCCVWWPHMQLLCRMCVYTHNIWVVVDGMSVYTPITHSHTHTPSGMGY